MQFLLKNKFLAASSTVFAGSMVANVLNYIFSILMGRLLFPEIFGELVSLLTILLLVSVPATTLTTILAHYTASDGGEGETKGVLFYKAKRFTERAALIGLCLMISISPFVAAFFKISFPTVLLFSLLVPLSFLSAMTGGLLQGLLGFKTLAITNAGTALLKLIFSIIFVLLGFSVNGIVLALILSSLIGYLYSFRMIKRLIPHVEVPSDSKNIFSGRGRYLGIVFGTTLALAIVLNADQLLAKHFLGSQEAGIYAALSTLGKIITYASAAILTVLFPLVSQSVGKDTKTTSRLLGTSLLVVGGISAVLVILFFLTPNLILATLFGARYLAASIYLGYFGLAMGLAALASVFVQYFLALHHKWALAPLVSTALLEIVGIWLYHGSIFSIVLVSVLTSALLLAEMVALYLITPHPHYE